jgi:hypothetical protein
MKQEPAQDRGRLRAVTDGQAMVGRDRAARSASGRWGNDFVPES